MRRFFRRKIEKNKLSEISENLEFFLKEPEKIRKNLELNRARFISLNEELGKLKIKLNNPSNDTILDDKEFKEQVGSLINTIELEIQKNKLNIIRIDEFLKL